MGLLPDSKKLGNHNKVNLCWVERQSGLQGNDTAGKLSIKDTNILFVGPESIVELTTTMGKDAIKNACKIKHYLRRSNTVTSQQTKELIVKPNGMICFH